MAQGGHRKVGLVIAGNLLELTRVQDLVDRDFAAQAADELWIADITYIPTWAGFLCLAVVIDAWSRRVVGWAMASHLRTELVLDALNMTLAQRHPEDEIIALVELGLDGVDSLIDDPKEAVTWL
jgi:putative transposase